MPVIAEFYGIKILMYCNENLPPHLKAEYAEHKIMEVPGWLREFNT